MFRLHALSIDSIAKMECIMNKIVIEQKQKSQHAVKNSFFDL